MTSYTDLPNLTLTQNKAIVQAVMRALRDNAIAIGEADSSVPAGLLPTVHLGTLTTTSGSTQTLSSLVLTPYKFLIFALNGVSTTSSGALDIGAANGITAAAASGAESISGLVWIDLATGIATGITAVTGSAGSVKVGASGYTNATTAVSISTSAVFDAGSVRIYGAK